MSHRHPLPWPTRFPAAFLPAIRFAATCAVIFVAVVGYGLYAKGFALFGRSAIALSLLALPPAAIAGATAYAVDVLLPRQGAVLRGLFMAVSLATFGPLASVGTFALQYRMSYPIEFQPIWTDIGFHQLAWTGIATIYMFAVTGIRLYAPWSPVALVFATVYFAARPCPTLRTAGPSAKDAASDTQKPSR